MPDDPKCNELYTYFDRQWLKNILPKYWNNFESNVRTNNRIEGFHSGLNKKISRQHSNIFLLINHLKIQQACTYVDYARIKLGQKIREVSKKDQEKEQKLEMLKNHYKVSNDISNYLLALNQFIQFPYEFWYDLPDQIQNYDENETENIQDSHELIAQNFEQAFEIFENDDESVREDLMFANFETISDLPNLWANEQDINSVSAFQNSGSSQAIRSTASIFLILDEINMSQNVDTDNFDNVGSLVNQEPLISMSNAKQREEERKIQLTAQYKLEITADDIANEVRLMWRINGLSSSRKRITMKDRAEALRSWNSFFNFSYTEKLKKEFLFN
ncbi:unnamed protein product [Brachionus calyciflorus]|uniref:Uncharacterized protein n=1 Tax=Brachionus calyciflorus TaxID=104777 RepID=A0A813S6Q0_9BILA|nr:unnamed protein product [Brachionus calyciflorus]